MKEIWKLPLPSHVHADPFHEWSAFQKMVMYPATAWLNTYSLLKLEPLREPVIFHRAQQGWLYCSFCYKGHSLTTYLPLCLFDSQQICVYPRVFSVWHLSNPGDSMTPSFVCCWIYCWKQGHAGVRPNQSKDRRTDKTSSCHSQLNKNDNCVASGGLRLSEGQGWKNIKGTWHSQFAPINKQLERNVW